MRMTHIDIPPHYIRNSQSVLSLGIETTGATLLDCGNQLLNWPDLATKDVLDIGCGTRFTQTIINCHFPIKSYTGIDIDAPLIDYLSAHVQDSRFSFRYWHVYNAKFNRAGQPLTKHTRLPLPGAPTYDLIWMYSVITHTDPWDTECLLTILRRVVNGNGALVFSAFLDPTIVTFADRLPDQPLALAYYNRAFLQQLIAKTGWQLDTFFDQRLDPVMQNLFVCRPQRRLWRGLTWIRQRLHAF